MRPYNYTHEEDVLWEKIAGLQGQQFETAKHLSFHFEIRSNEMFVSRKEKSITRATVNMAYHNAKAMHGDLCGPKQLKTFGASYLYPIFQHLGIIKAKAQLEMDLLQKTGECK